MANSRIIINFEGVPALNAVLKFRETTRAIDINETFKTSRLGSFQVQLPVYVPASGGYPARFIGYVNNFYTDAFNLDYNSFNLFIVTSINGEINSGAGQVIIEANFPNANFIPIEIPDSISLNIENVVDLPPIEITDYSFSEVAVNKCQNVKVNVTTSILASKVLSPVVINPNTANPFSFDGLRGETVNIVVEDSNGKQDSKTVILPSILNASNIILNVNNSPNGATIVVSNTNSSGLVLEYSLDNITWQTSNVFSGLSKGNYSLYVKDQFGCSVNKSFFVDDFGIQSPYFYISKSNSIRYAKRVDWGISGNYKNDENTLSCEVDVDVIYTEVQQFNSVDNIPTQFKSNYSSITAKVIKEDLSEVIIPIEKKSQNIGIKDKRDARKYDLGNGKTGLYFISGNTYDFDTNAVSGTYSLNGLLPEWAVAGNYVVIGTYWFLIEEIIYDDIKNADVIVYSEIYSGPEINLVVGSIFNRFNYEVYEFFIDMSYYIDQNIQVKLINADPNFSTVTYLSEMLWSREKHDDLIEIRYRNSTNTDIFYSTGIEFLLRIPLTIIKGKVDEGSENHKTDTNVVLLNAELYEGDEFVFEPVTKEIWRKLMIALSHEKVMLNGVSYIKNGNFSTEGPLEKSNLYVLTAPMLKTGNVYNLTGNEEIGGEEIEIPGLITTESGFVSYI